MFSKHVIFLYKASLSTLTGHFHFMHYKTSLRINSKKRKKNLYKLPFSSKTCVPKILIHIFKVISYRRVMIFPAESLFTGMKSQKWDFYSLA